MTDLLTAEGGHPQALHRKAFPCACRRRGVFPPFQGRERMTEFARILKPRGRLAAIWNDRDRQYKFTAEYSHLTTTVSNNQSELRYGTERFLRQTASFSKATQLTFPCQQALDREGLVGRAMSTSYIPKTEKPKEEFIEGLNEIYDKYRDERNLVYLKYNTNVYLTSLLVNTDRV